MWQRPRSGFQGGLSKFLIGYLAMLLTVLLSVHLLQPERSGPGTSSRSPVHQVGRA
jgi:hypothetical protein